MKLKGITVFEQHAEKAVLGVFALFALVMLVLQFGLLGSAGTIKVGNRDVRPEQAPELIRTRALEKKGGLERPDPDPTLPKVDALATITSRIEAAVAQPVSPAPTLAALGVPDVPRIGGAAVTGGPTDGGTASGTGSVMTFDPPALSTPIAGVIEGTIDPAVVASAGNALASLLPASQPFDKRAITVVTTLDSAAVRAALLAESNGRAAIPPAWWQGRVELLDLEVVRQEQGPDGSWGGEKLLDPPPLAHGEAVRGKLSAPEIDSARLRELLQFEQQKRAAIRRPPYPAMISGGPWQPPTAAATAVTSDPNQSRIEKLLAALSGKRAEIAGVEAAIKKASEVPTPNEGGAGKREGQSRSQAFPATTTTSTLASASGRSAGSPSGIGGAVAGGGGGGGGGGGRRDGDSKPAPKSEEERREDAKKARADGLQRRLTKLKGEETKLLEQLKALGMDPDAKAKTPDATEAVPALTEPTVSLTDRLGAEVTLWSHDFTAQPGKTYRYRTRAVLGNPFFGQAERLTEGQKPMAASATVRTPDSEWSAPVTLEPNEMYMVLSAVPAGVGPIAAPPIATVQAFRFYYGYWRQGIETLGLGDTIAAQLDMPELATFQADPKSAGVWTRVPMTSPAAVLVLDEYVLDVAASEDRASESAVLFVGDSSGGVRVRTTEDLASLAQRLNASAKLGQEATIQTPGTSPAAVTPAESASDRRETGESEGQPRN